MTEQQLDVLHFLVSVKREYLETPLSRVNAEYGSLLNFITQRMHVPAATIDALREYYLE